MTTQILLLHGPNLNLLGIREPNVYGDLTLDQVNDLINAHARQYNVQLRTSQSNHEGELLDMLHVARNWADGVVFNPGAYTHTSIALQDAVTAIKLPVVEVHMSNIYTSPPYPDGPILATACLGHNIWISYKYKASNHCS